LISTFTRRRRGLSSHPAALRERFDHRRDGATRVAVQGRITA